MASNILKIEGAVNKSHLLPGPNRRFYSEMRDHLNPGTNIKYEVISAQINNDISTPDAPDLKLSVAAKLDRTSENATTEFCKVQFTKKGQKATGHGQGFATLRPSTFIDKLNSSLKAHPFLAKHEDYTPFSINQTNHLEVNLLPFMGLYLNHEYLFEDVFKFNNTNSDAYDKGDSPKWNF